MLDRASSSIIMADIDIDSMQVEDEYGNQATSSLWIKYVPVNTNGVTLQEYFMRWGQVESVAPVGHAKARSGWAIINYYTIEDSIRAYQSENNRTLFDGDHPCFIKFTPARDVARPRARPKLDAAALAARDEWFGSSSRSTGITVEDRSVAPHEFIRPPPAAPKSMRRQVSPPPIQRAGEPGASRMYEADTWRLDYEDRTRLDRASDSWRLYGRYDPRAEEDVDTGLRRGTADTYRHVVQDSDRAQVMSPECKTGFRNKSWVKPAQESAKEGATAPKSTSHIKPPTIRSPIDSAKARAIEVAKRLALTSPVPIPASLAPQQLPSLSNHDTARKSTMPPSPEPSPTLDSNADQQTGEVLLTCHTLSSSLFVPRLKNTNDETTSINSSSTHTSVRKRACADCKDIETSISPFTKCAGCTRRFHQTCGNPPPSATKTGNFRCGKCLRREALACAPSTSKSSQAEVEGTTLTPDKGQINTEIKTHDHHVDAVDDTIMLDDPLRNPVPTPTPRTMTAADKRQTSDLTNTFRPERPQCTKRWPTSDDGTLIVRRSGSVYGEAPREAMNGTERSAEKLVDGRSAPAATRKFDSRSSEAFKVQTADRCESPAISNSGNFFISRGRTQSPSPPRFTMVDGVANAPQLVMQRKHDPDHHLSPKEIAQRYKGLTCPFWQRGYCRLAGEDCHYAHRRTGIDGARNGNPAKHFTCFYWIRGEHCGDGDYCRFAHEDTGIYVTEYGDPSLKHVTCSFWRLSSCRNKAPDCGFAHEDTGVYIDQRKESQLITPRPSRYGAAPERWLSTVIPAPQVDRDPRDSSFKITQPLSRSAALEISTRDDDDGPEVCKLRVNEARSNHQRSADDAALTSDAESRPAPEAPIVRTACIGQPLFETTKSNQAPLHSQQTSSMADTPSQSGTLKSLEPASSNPDGTAAAKALYASFGISFESPPDNPPKARISAPDVDTAASPMQQELSGQLIHGIDTPHSPGATSSVSDATAPYSPLKSVTNPPTHNQHMGTATATSTATSQVGSDPEPKGLDHLLLGSAHRQTSSTQTANDHSSNFTEERTAAEMVPASAEPPRHFSKRSGRDPRKEPPSEPVADSKLPTSTTPTAKTCELCSKKIFSGLLCKACQRTDTVPDPALRQPSLMDEEVGTDAMSIITELAASVKPNLDTQAPKPAYTEHGPDDAEKNVKAVSEKPDGVTSSLKRPAETSPFIKQKRPKTGPWLPCPVVRHNVDESPEAAAARRALESFKEQEALRKAHLRQAVPQVLRQDAQTPDGTDSNKENRQPSTVPSEATSTEASSVRLTGNRNQWTSQRGFGVGVSPPSDQERPAVLVGRFVEKSSVVAARSPQPAVTESSRCCNCRDTHKRCFHTRDGSAYDASRCKEYLEEHPNASRLTLAISWHAFQKIVKAAKTAGFCYPSPERVQDVDDDDEEEEEEYSPPPPVSPRSVQFDSDDSSDDDRPIYQTKKRKSQAETATLMEVARFRNNTVVSMESSLQKSSVDPRRRDFHGTAKHPRDQECAVLLSMPEPHRPAQDISINLQEAIAKLKARGVEFESDSCEDTAEDLSVSTREKITPGPPGSSLDLYDIAPSLRSQKNDNEGRRSGLLSANEVGHISKKEVWKTLLARQCRERKLKFGDPHQEVQREIGSRTVSTLIKRDAPEDRARAKVDRFHVPAKEEKVIRTTFENFLGIPKEPVVCREWSGEGHKMWHELAYRDGGKGVAEAPFSRRNAGDEKYVFTKS